MDRDELSVTGAVRREPVHPTITPKQISDLVEQFYGRVRNDDRLAPIFARRIDGDWTPHLDKMKGFWRSVLLRTAEYKGRPVPVHMQVGGIEDQDYVRWLELFRETVAEVFEPGAQPLVIAAAERIASSLWLATSGQLLSKPPEWKAGSEAASGDQSGER